VKKIKVGVVGVGYFGQFHAEKYARMEGAELAGVADIDPSRAKEVAERCRTRPFTSHADLFDKVQAVSISVPTLFHSAIAKEFLFREIDVLLEKPIAHSLEEADEMIGLANSKGLILQVGHLERFNGALQASRGLISDPRYIESERSSPFPARGIDVNVILDLMIHDIDILLSLIESPIKEIQAVGIPVLTSHSDIANARIEFENGCVAGLTVNRVSEEKVRRTRLFSPEGTLSIDYLRQKVSRSKKSSSSRILTEEIPVKSIDTLETEIEAFLRSVRDRSPAQVSAEDGKRALEAAFKVIEKIEERMKRRKGRR
jgi:predicted dehydrogenase